MTRVRRAVALSVLLIALAGCGGGGAPKPEGQTPQTGTLEVAVIGGAIQATRIRLGAEDGVPGVGE